MATPDRLTYWVMLASWVTLATGVILAGGCQTPPTLRPPPAPLPLGVIVDRINANTHRISTTLRASGPVDGALVTGEGRRVSFHVDGVMFFLKPTFLRFDLKKLGDRQLLLGSNATDYWLYTKEDDEFLCGRHGMPDDLASDLPIRPDQIADALALHPIDLTDADAPVVQRIVDDYQQLLFLARSPSHGSMVRKEYWIDRRPPRVVRRVVFRDEQGAVEMASELDDYRIQSDGSLYLPHAVKVTWAQAQMTLVFTVKQWRLESGVTRDGPQFATPRECRP